MTDTQTEPVRRRVLVIGVVLLIVAAAVLDLVHPFGSSPSHPFGTAPTAGAASATPADPPTTEPVARRTLSEQTTVDATLGYAGDYTVVNQSGSAGQRPSQAVLTSVPAEGRVVSQGQVLYQVDSRPVVLLYGSTPAYRNLADGVPDGADVRQLNADLVALGYASRSDLDPSSDEFSAATKTGVQNLQEHLGVDQTGALRLGQVVFLPTAIRVTNLSASLGATVASGTPVLTGTSTTRQVTVDLDTSDQSEVRVGDRVSVTLPDNQTTPGVVTSVGTVASSESAGDKGSGQPTGSSSSDSGSSSDDSTVEVDVRLSHPAAASTWDQAPVQVTITTDTVRDALVVPVVALLARSGGGYAVEVAPANGSRRLVPVSLGIFDDADGMVQVTGGSLTAGQLVVVPKL
ncbi:MAG TPA: HlyD family efflux transporter periplasmic adaptor subunit [Pseudonocardiaceae bacterium]|nr:HlyD family efflux transporter periplasmic adaptor subunit [Pseudonocardiaceae bacterium]